MIWNNGLTLCEGIFLSGLLCFGCESGPIGKSLPEHALQFPVGIAVHPQGFALVVSSNFDLAYESGSVQAIDLDQLADSVAKGQGLDTTDYHQDLILTKSGVGINSFGSSIKISEDGKLALVAVRENSELVLIGLTIREDPKREYPSDIQMDCWSGLTKPSDDNFPLCDGSRSVFALEQDDPFDILMYPGLDISGETGSTAFVTSLTLGTIEAVQIPSDLESEDSPRTIYTLATSVLGTNDLARSPATGLVFVTSRFPSSQTNPIYYFDPSLGRSAKVQEVDLFGLLLGNETRGIDFVDDGVGNIATVLVKNPDMLVFLDTTPGIDGLPVNEYLGAVSVGNSPSRVRSVGNLVFVTCAQDDAIYVIDANTRRLLSVREDICRGPFDIDFFMPTDRPIQWALVTCFEDDNVAVLDVDPNSNTFLNVVAYVGQPREE